MNILEQINQLTQRATNAGYQIRYEHFGGSGGGICEFGGKKVLFLDLALSAMEQLEMLKTTLSKEGLVTLVKPSFRSNNH